MQFAVDMHHSTPNGCFAFYSRRQKPCMSERFVAFNEMQDRSLYNFLEVGWFIFFADILTVHFW
jgi:hypothetical protein